MSWQDPKRRPEYDEKHYVPKLNVWAGIGYYFKTDLYFIEGNLTAEKYQEILRKNLPPSYLPDCPSSIQSKWIFMQDGARPHTAKKTIELLDELDPDRIQDHPPNSPDFNPIEDVWSYLDREIRKVGSKSIKDLKRKLRTLWDDMPIEVIRASVKSMPKRLQQCVKLEGQRTQY